EGGELTWVGTDQLVHPEAALATLTKAWRRAGFVLLPTQATYRLRAESMDVTTKFALSLASAGWFLATTISLRALPLGWVASGASRKVRFPDASGVPMFSRMLAPLNSAWNTLPVTW